MWKPIVGVVGTGKKLSRAASEEACRLGGEIAQKKFILLCGGKGGVMEAAAAGAKRTDPTRGRIGIHPGKKNAASAIDCAIYTELGDARNYVNVHASDVVVALAGGFGTLSEIALAIKLKRPVVLFPTWSFLEAFCESEHATFASVATPVEAIEAVVKLLPKSRTASYPELPGQSKQKKQYEAFVAQKDALD